MPTLVLSPRFTDDSTALWRAAIARGWEIVRATGWQLPPRIDRPVLYGETMFVEWVAEQLGVTLVEPHPAWTCRVPWELRRRHLWIGTLDNVRRSTAPVFCKPLERKAWTAAVWQPGQDLAPAFENSERALFSDPIAFGTEVRCWVLGGKVLTSSIYRGDPVDTGRATAAAELAAHYYAPEAVAIDVGQIADGSWVVVEANPASSSGIYGADPDAVLDVLERATIPKEH